MKIYKTLVHLSVLALLVGPLAVNAAGLVPCGGTDATGNPENACTFNDLILMVNKLVQFALYTLAIPLTALAFMYAGARLVLFPEKEHEWSDAKERFLDIGKGFAIIMVAFLGIKFVLFTFLTTDQYNFVNFLIKLD